MTRTTSAPADDGALRTLSVVIPARDEEGSLTLTVPHLHEELARHHIAHEIVVVDDGSRDRTWEVLAELAQTIPELRPVHNASLHGFGRAVVRGIDAATGDAVVIMMADESDDCCDVVRYWQALNEGFDAVFGSRFIAGGRAIDYPLPKYLLHRVFNTAVRLLFGFAFNDTNEGYTGPYRGWAQWEQELTHLYRVYVEQKQHSRLLDYDDLLLYWHGMMAEPRLAQHIGAHFDHVLVDELARPRMFAYGTPAPRP